MLSLGPAFTHAKSGSCFYQPNPGPCLDIIKQEQVFTNTRNYWIGPTAAIRFELSRAMRKGVLCHMRPIKAQISLRIRAV